MSDSAKNSTVMGPSVVPKLEIIQGDSVGKDFRLKFKTRIGREADNDVVITDPRISRYHCQVAYENGSWMVVDLGSANSTRLNGRRLGAPETISHGDQLGLGETVLVFIDPVEEKKSSISRNPLPAAVQGQLGGDTRRLARIAGGLVLLLFLAFAGIFLWLQSNQSEQIALTPAATEGAPAVDGNVNNPGAEPNRDLVLQYEDDFSDSNSGWDDASGPFYTKRYGNNQYNVDIGTNNLVVWGMANRNASDFEVSVEATKRQGSLGNTYGILFRFVDNDNYYRFDISSDGFFHLAKLENGQWDILVDWVGTSVINQGNESNVLKVSAFGPEISVSVNEQELASVTDTSFDSGNFGFFASTFDDPNIWVSFDNLRLYTPAGQELAMIPTATPVPLEQAQQRTLTVEEPAPPADSPPAEAPPAETPTPAFGEATALPAEPAPDDTPEVSIPEATMTPDELITTTLNLTETEGELGEPTPTPLPDFVSRDQFLGRSEQALPGKLVFPVYDASRGTYDIYRANLDGTERELLVNEASQPDMNAAGTLLTYRSWKGDERGLISQELGATDKWRYIIFGEAAQPIFSPDGQFFVFHSRQGGETPALYRTFGTEHEVLRREGFPLQGSMPAFSPDGRLVYRGCLNNSCGLTITNLDGGNPQQLTDYANDTAPSVSPDGSQVAFMSDRDGNWEIYVMGIDGQNLRRLTEDANNDGLPVWSPDGGTLAFVSARDGEWAVWAMTAAGNQQRKLFPLNGSIDGVVSLDTASSFGWLEENLDWTP